LDTQIIIPLYYVAAGITFFLAIQAALLAGFGYARSQLLWFAWLCLSASGYELASALHYASADYEFSVSTLHWQSASLLLALPAIYAFFGLYTHYRYTYWWVTAASLNSVVLLLADWRAPVSLRFVGDTWMQIFTLPWGEKIFYLVGDISFSGMQLHVSGQILIGWSLWRAWVIRKRDINRFYFLLIFLLIMFASILYGLGAEFGYFHSIKVIGFSFLSLVILMAVSLAVDIRRMMDEFRLQHEQLLMERSIIESLRQDQERLSQVVEQSPYSIHLIDEHGQLLQKNQASQYLWRDDSESGDRFFSKNPWSHLQLETVCRRVLDTGELYSDMIEVPAHFLRAAERNKWVKLTVFTVIGADGHNEGIAIVSEDVSRQQVVQNALEMAAAGTAQGADFFSGIASQLSMLFNANFVYVARLTADEDALKYTSLAFVVGGEARDNFTGSVTDSIAQLGLGQRMTIIDSRVRQQFPDDEFLEYYSVEAAIILPLRSENGEKIGFIAVMDCTALRHVDDVLPILEIMADRVAAEMQRLDAETRIRRMAYEDYITRLPNRAMLHEYMQDLLRTLEGSGLNIAAYFLDLDHFKTINEALGHDVGDDVLRKAANRLRSTIDESVFIARLGGDEFVLVERFSSSANLDQKIRLRAAQIISLLSKPLEIGERIVSLGTSIGVLKIPEHASSELDVMRRGDSALFKAKQEGRNRFEFYDPSMQANIDERLEIERGLRIALEANHLDVYFQPKVNPLGKVVGAEALIRWKHPTHGYISPARFIPVAEETGLIHLIGEWILEHISQKLISWQQSGLAEFGDVSINISAWQFARPDFIRKTLAAIRLNNLPINRIAFEVTETAILRDIGSTKAKLAQLREAGIYLALDDFGTGYSSLAYLKDLPLDAFKIDRAFVSELHNKQTAALVNSMIAIGNHMDLDVIAEGVETPEQFEMLADMGCQIFQGFLFAKPMPEAEFLLWLEKNNA